MKQIGVWVQGKTVEAVLEVAGILGISLSEFVRRAIEDSLFRNGMLEYGIHRVKLEYFRQNGSRLVRQKRIERGWTQQKLAEEVGVSQSGVSLIESGKVRQPAKGTIAGLEAALGCSLLR